MNMVVLSCLFAAILFFGCVGGDDAQPVQTPEAPAAVPQTPAAPQGLQQVNETVEIEEEEEFEPIHLTYSLMFYIIDNKLGENRTETATVDYWLTEKEECNGRPAYLGIMHAKQEGMQREETYAKITAYADNGEIAVSGFSGASDLMFDSAEPRPLEMDLLLTLNTLFASAGENFMQEEVWNSTKPVILKDVADSRGKSVNNYSIIRTGEEDALLPCITYTLAVKGEHMRGSFTTCAAKMDENIPLPFIVYYNVIGDGMMSWSLESYSNELPSTIFYPQCLLPTKCEYIGEPSKPEWSECDKKDGHMETVFDNAGCPTEHICIDNIQRARRELKSSQPPHCTPVSDSLVQKLAKCQKEGKGEISDMETDEDGCIISFECR
ncbi:MAG: hypothetical protein ABIH83_02380 [Candidatus Micrarchaeota archaeon]